MERQNLLRLSWNSQHPYQNIMLRSKNADWIESYTHTENHKCLPGTGRHAQTLAKI